MLCSCDSLNDFVCRFSSVLSSDSLCFRFLHLFWLLARLETEVIPLGPDIWLEQQFPNKESQWLIAFAASVCWCLLCTFVIETLFETLSWSLKSYRLVAGQADAVRRLDRWLLSCQSSVKSSVCELVLSASRNCLIFSISSICRCSHVADF